MEYNQDASRERFHRKRHESFHGLNSELQKEQNSKLEMKQVFMAEMAYNSLAAYNCASSFGILHETTKKKIILYSQ